MKKLPIVLLALLMVISLFSCAEPENTPPRYAITYSGIERDPESITAGEKYKLPADLPKPEEGYKLVVKMGNVVLEAGKEYEITADTVLQCSYEKLKFKLTVDGTEQPVEYGDTYTILKKKDGKIMKSVKVDDKAFTEASFVIKKDTTVVYEWRDPATYTVRFEGDDIAELKSFTVTEGNPYKLPALPKKENYKLVVKNGEQEIQPGTEYEISSDITLTCSWERTHYKVSFAGEAPLPSAFNVEVGKKYSLPVELPENEGYKLVIKKGTEVLVAGESYDITADTVLQCSWEKLKFTLTVDGKAQTVEYGDTYTIEKTKPGKKLVSVKVDGTDCTDDSIVIKNNTTVDYVWAYTVTYNGLDTVPQDVTSELQKDVICDAQFTVPYIKGYLIDSIKNGSVPVKPGDIIKPTSNITLTYTVKKGSDLQYTKPDASGNVYVTKYANDSSKYKDNIVIPDMNSDGKLVTGIGDEAFGYCRNLTSIIIPESIKAIGKFSFIWCENLTSITIHDGVTSIGEKAFYGCSSLTSITIPDSVTSIGSGAFEFCRNLTSITIPNSVTSIGESAFEGCSKLTTINVSKPKSACTSWGTGWHGATAEHNVTVKYTDKTVVYPTTP